MTGATHYYSEKQTSKLNLRKINAVLRSQNFEFYTGSGVFSGKKVDLGTKLLIDKCIMKKGWHVLDLGCGYGPVGVSVAKLFPDTSVFMTDVNSRAVMLAKKNAKLNDVDVVAVKGDLFEKVKKIRGKFDTILLNPPQTAGKKLCFEMIEISKRFLFKGGLLQLVARHQKGGKGLSKKMKEVFGNVKEIAKKSGYRIYVSECVSEL